MLSVQSNINKQMFRDTNGTSLRIRFDANSEGVLNDLSNNLSHICSNYHLSVSISKSIQLLPRVEENTGLPFDKLYEVLRRTANEFDTFPVRLINQCEIIVDENGQSLVYIQLFCTNLVSLINYMAETFGLVPEIFSVKSNIVLMQVATCYAGYEYELPGVKGNIEALLKKVSQYILLNGESLELAEQFPGLLSPITATADRTVFRFEGGKVKARRSLVRLEGDDSLESNIDEIATRLRNGSRESPTVDDLNFSYGYVKPPVGYHDTELRPNSLENGYRANVDQSQTIFAFNGTSPNTTPYSYSAGGSDNGQIPFQRMNTPPYLQGSYSQPSPGRTSFGQASPSSNLGQGNYGLPQPSGTQSRASVNVSDFPLSDREYQSSSRPSSQQNHPWSDVGSDVAESPYDIYRSTTHHLINTRQRQHSDPVVPDTRSRQYSDPVVPNLYRHGYNTQSSGPLPARRVQVSSNISTPERVPSIDGTRPPTGLGYFSGPPAPIPAPSGGGYSDIISRGRSISESGTLAEGETIQQHYRVVPGGYHRGSMPTCPSCQTVVKRNQTVCYRCRSPLPLANQTVTTDYQWSNGTRTLYSSHPSDQSLNSDHGSQIHGDSQHKPETTIREGDWMCVYCHGHNFATKIACFTCHAARPGFERGIPVGQLEALGIGRLGGSSAEAKPGDWECPKCHENVFAKRNRCYRCTTARPRKLSH